ncbi:MAG: efflux RND transporter periplasmic adaptor subunit [Phycisphaerales bacterium]
MSTAAAKVNRKKWLMLTAGLGGLAAVGAILAAATSAERAPPSAGGKERADTGTAEVTSFDVTVVARGQLEAKNQIELRNPLEFQTTITEICKEGITAKAGDVLVRLNADNIQTQVDETKLLIETAKAELTTATNGYEIQVNENDSALRKAKLAVDLAELDLRQWERGEVRSRRQQYGIALEEARREHARLSEKLEQARPLLAKGFLSKDEFQRDDLASKKAESALAKAQLDLETYESFQLPKEERTKQSALEEARSELERVDRKNESQLASKGADKANKAQQLALRTTRLAKLEGQVASATIKAPSDGLVVYSTSLARGWWNDNAGPLQVGRQVHPNELLIALPDTSEMVAAVKVPESIAGRIQKGQRAVVKIDALGGQSVNGTVDSVGLIAEGGGWSEVREFTLKVVLEKSGLAIRPSMRCEGEVFIDRAENVLAVPIQAVASDGPVQYVLVADGSAWRKRPVKLDKRSDRFAGIAVGLKAGERILLRTAQAGELANKPWDKAELAAVGWELKDDGKVVAKAQPAPTGGAAPATAVVKATELVEVKTEAKAE